MEKHYLIQNRKSNCLYHFNLCDYDTHHRYDYDLSFLLGHDTPYSNIQSYQYLVYLLSVISGFNERNVRFLNLKQCLKSVGFNNIRMSEDLLILDEKFKYLGSSYIYTSII